MAFTFTDANFAEQVLQADKPVIVDFYAMWCRPCHAMTPIIDKLHEDYSVAKVGKLNIDENQETANRYDVNAIPTIIVFKDGKPAVKLVGVQTEQALQEAVKTLL